MINKKDFLSGFYFGYIGSLIVLSYIQSRENEKMINKLRVNAELQIDKHAELLKSIIEYKSGEHIDTKKVEQLYS